MMKKIFLSFACVLLLTFAFMTCAFAAEYTVSTADEFNAVFAEATDGDTIIIKESISAPYDFGKSITYILDGDGIVWTAGARCSAAGKDVSILSRGGNNSFKPNAAMWCNTYAITVQDLTSTTWTLGALDENSVMTFDLSLVSCRLFYGTYLDEINFKNGTHITKCNNTNPDNAAYFCAKTVNMYEGAKIYGNYIQPYRGLFKANTFNIYGGEIYGNFFFEYGMIVAISGTPVVNMFGGEIYGNYISFSNAGVNEGIFNNATFNMYAGKLRNNLVKGNATSKQSILYGTKRIIDGSIYENYYVTAWSNPTLNENGVYQTEIDLSGATMLGNGLGSTTTFKYAVIFKSSDSSVINAYMIKDDGTVLKAFDGSTEITVPDCELGWAIKSNYCVTQDVDVTKGATYYKAVLHTYTDDYDCTTALICQKCALIIDEAMEHTLIEQYIYKNGYSASGEYGSYCQNSGCDHKIVGTLDPLFVNKGYTVDKVNGTGFAYSVYVNDEAIKYYAEKTGVKITYGFIVGLANGSDGDIMGKNGEAKLENAIVTDFTDLSSKGYEIFTLKLTDIVAPEQKAKEIFACAYVASNDGVSYLAKEETLIAKSVTLEALLNDEN